MTTLGPEHWTAIILALITLFGTVVGAIFTWLGGLNKRTAEMRSRLEKLERRDRLSWLYIRSLIDHAYRHGALPLPEPPDGWNEKDD